MLIISIIFLILLLWVLIFYPLILKGSARLYNAKNITFKNALVTGIIALLVEIFFETLSYIFKIKILWFNSIVSIISLAVIIWIVKKRFGTTVLKTIGIYVTSILFSVAIALFIRTYVVQAFKIPSGSMMNTIQIGDHLLVNKYIYKFKSPEKGEIIVFRYPKDTSKDYIERVIAVGGDIIEIKNKELYINNELIHEPYVSHIDSRIFSNEISPRDNFGPVAVPEDSYFVMGDNRDNSLDSRFWGFLESKYVKGKAFVIYWSWDKENGTQRADRIGKSL